MTEQQLPLHRIILYQYHAPKFCPTLNHMFLDFGAGKTFYGRLSQRRSNCGTMRYGGKPSRPLFSPESRD